MEATKKNTRVGQHPHQIHKQQHHIKPKSRKGRKIMKTMISVSEIINEVRNGGHVRKLSLKDASRYAANSKGEMSWATTLVEKAYVNRQEGDEIIQLGNKQVNITELTRILNVMVGKGEVSIWIGNKAFGGELVAD